MKYTIRHETRCHFDHPASFSIRNLRITPREEAGLRIENWRVSTPGRSSCSRDTWGNTSHLLTLTEPHENVRILVTGVVDVPDEAVSHFGQGDSPARAADLPGQHSAPGKAPSDASLKLIRKLRVGAPVIVQLHPPSGLRLRSLVEGPAEMPLGLPGHPEGRFGRPSQVLLGERHFRFAQRRAVRGEGVLLVRRAVAEVGAHQDQRGAPGFPARLADGAVQGLQVVAVRRPSCVCQP